MQFTNNKKFVTLHFFVISVNETLKKIGVFMKPSYLLAIIPLAIACGDEQKISKKEAPKAEVKKEAPKKASKNF